MAHRDDSPAVADVDPLRARWANDGCEALQLSLVRASLDIEALDTQASAFDDERPTERERLTSTFSPLFVYPIFGEAQVRQTSLARLTARSSTATSRWRSRWLSRRARWRRTCR